MEYFAGRRRPYINPVRLLNVVLIAAFHHGIYYRRRYFVEHLVFSLHLASFVLLFSLPVFGMFDVALLLSWWSVQASHVMLVIAVLIMYCVQIRYFQLALMRFYYPDEPGKRWRALAATFAALAANSLFITVVHLLGAAVALLRV